MRSATQLDIGEMSSDASPRFLRNTWYVAAWAQDVVAGAIFSRRILGESIVLFREAGGAPTGRGGGGTGTVVIHIPARPFLQPAFEKWRVGARERLLRRLGNDLFGGLS